MKKYFLHRSGENHGPYEESQMRELISSQEIGAEELICEEGGTEWVAASTLLTPVSVGTVPPQQMPARPQAAVSATVLAQPAKKRMHGCLQALLLGVGVLVVLSIIGFYFWSKDNALREHGIAQIETISESEDEKLTYLALAEYYHLNAANSGTRVTKRSTSRPSKEGYWVALKEAMIKDLRDIPASPAFDQVAGNTYLNKDFEEDCQYLLKLNSNGSYIKTKHYDKGLKSASETEKGTWKATSGGFVWGPSGGTQETQKILRMGRNGFILRIDSESAKYWKLRRSR